jgi:hypothetical protein
MWQDKNSNLVLQQRLVTLDHSDYTVHHDPTGDAVAFTDPIGYWFTPFGHGYPQSKHKGQNRVLCTIKGEGLYAPYNTDQFGHTADVVVGAGFVEAGIWEHNFVQSLDCPEDPEDPSLLDPETGEYTPREALDVCVTYLETDCFVYEMTLSGKPDGRVQAASADGGDTQSADHPQKSKHKHKKGGNKRQKGKRGR